MATAFISHSACQAHLSACDHPDRPERLSAIRDRLVFERLFDFLLDIESPRATVEQLERAHDPRYIRDLLADIPGTDPIRVDEDTWKDNATAEAALRAAGAVIHAADLVMATDAANAFCSIRPPGHHATANRSMGFCFINNVAVGVRHAQAVHGVKRIAVLDFDAHHGNGTEAILGDDPGVLMCSVFQGDHFSEQDRASDSGRCVNVELGLGAGGDQLKQGVLDRWQPALESFRPEILFVSAGFDAHIEDPISDLQWGDADYAWLSQFMVEMAETHARGRLISVLEGGYDPDSLARCAALHVRKLMKL